MPNNKGGKNYKKSKHAVFEPVMHEILPGQMYGRVTRILGNCNVVVYCNDDVERICHIRGNMRRKVWLGAGDIVLISLRTLDANDDPSKISRGDICVKYDERLIYRLQQKDKSINPRLFTNIEKKQGAIPDEDAIEFDETAGNDSNSDDSESENSQLGATRLQQRQNVVLNATDDINIDNI